MTGYIVSLLMGLAVGVKRCQPAAHAIRRHIVSSASRGDARLNVCMISLLGCMFSLLGCMISLFG